nr:unnamed protein product [Spirometra erinaceieuropaei]
MIFIFRLPDQVQFEAKSLPDWGDRPYRPLPDQVPLEAKRSPVATRVKQEDLPDWGDRPYRPRKVRLPRQSLERCLPKKKVIIEMPAHRYFVDVPRMQ